MKEGFNFNEVNLMFLRKFIFKNFGGGGGGTEKSPRFGSGEIIIHRNEWHRKTAIKETNY